MVTSARRQPRHPSAASQRSRRARAAAVRRQARTGGFGPTDMRHLLAATRAAARGDASAALESYGRIRRFQGNFQATALEQLIELEGSVPSWATARWMCAQAVRQFAAADPAHDQTFEALFQGGYVAEALRTWGAGADLHEVLVYLVGADWAYRQLHLYEYGGLRHMIDVAGPGLLERAGPVAEWCTARLGGYRIESATPRQVSVEDLATGDVIEVLDVGTAAEGGQGAFVLGRLVAVDTPPGLFFESRPLLVDGETARAVARRRDGDPLSWLQILTRAVVDGRVGAELAWRPEWPLMSDVPSGLLDLTLRGVGDPPLARWLERQGVRAEVQHAVGICDLFLREGTCPAGAHEVPAIVAAAVLTPGAMPYLSQHIVSPERAAAWRSVAHQVHEPARGRCLELADLCVVADPVADAADVMTEARGPTGHDDLEARRIGQVLRSATTERCGSSASASSATTTPRS